MSLKVEKIIHLEWKQSKSIQPIHVLFHENAHIQSVMPTEQTNLNKIGVLPT